MIDNRRGVPAVYTASTISSFGGNPLIEALPPIPTAEEILTSLKKHPAITDEAVRLPPEHRAHEITDQLQDNFFEPLPENVQLFRKLDRLIRRGYKYRNPLDACNAARFEFDREGNGSRVQFESPQRIGEPPAGFGLSIIGISGIGKTIAIDRALSYYKQVITHSEYKGQTIPISQVVWVKLQAPPGGSMKALAIAFLEEIDRLCGTEYKEKNKRAGLDQLLTEMANIAFHQGVGMIVIDEVQALSRGKSSRGRIAVLDLLTSLKNVVGVPVVLVGTPASLSVINGEFRQARRVSSVGDFLWRRRPNDDSFDHLCRSLWEFQWLADPVAYSPECREMLYHCSQGITDLVVKLFQESQIRAAENGSERVTPALLHRVMEEDFQLLWPIIEAIRTGELEKVLPISDVSMPEKVVAEALNSDRQDIETTLTQEEILSQLLEDAMSGTLGGQA